jgi:hypothetical protein
MYLHVGYCLQPHQKQYLQATRLTKKIEEV